jgi:hypothetical protein
MEPAITALHFFRFERSRTSSCATVSPKDCACSRGKVRCFARFSARLPMSSEIGRIAKVAPPRPEKGFYRKGREERRDYPASPSASSAVNDSYSGRSICAFCNVSE